MILQFTLSMPNIGSWNGKWTGKDTLYAIVRSFGRSKYSKTKADNILEKGYYYYNFGDGWGAGISVEKIDAKIAAKIKRKSSGFCGYDWMVDSIIDYGDIYDTTQRKEQASILTPNTGD